VAAISAVVLVVSYGAERLSRVEAAITRAPTVRVGLVQGNIGIREKGDVALFEINVERYAELSEALQGDVDVVIWPESVAQWWVPADASRLEPKHRPMPRLQKFLIFGGLAYQYGDAEQPEKYNSAFLIDGEGNVVQDLQPRTLWDIADGVLTPGTPDQNVDPWVIDVVQEGMHRVTLDEPGDEVGTAFGYGNLENISSAGKTGTGEFCDALALRQNRCIPGRWPTHSWYAAYAPFENPEIAVVAFVYNGSEGAITAGPVVRQVLEAYFELKAIDVASGSP